MLNESAKGIAVNKKNGLRRPQRVRTLSAYIPIKGSLIASHVGQKKREEETKNC
jgi:hypothetical protein